ncbi:hypothetical protein FC093_12515 [Ilyomonas limi]|uniref:Polysaccharide chain length determinant N-terminal domain-containing protein n=1 Tax=Ilyomonas limi TaxID=2575867 RepID=A0A4U3KZQ6_9BACT|nr:hypothetical protein [Ilyomonas limi]TKK68030.1 hypothetical protein FC093_12515 [Ilyomonas limi]
MPASINYISIKNFVAKAKDWIRYLAARRVRIVIVALIGGIIGLMVALFSKPTYTGNLTFVLSSESNPSGGLMALANQFGLSFGSKNNAFDGENIIKLFESKKMFERALFQTIPQNNQLLINEMCREENFFKDWQKEARLQPLIPFTISDTAATGVKDSLITEVYKYALLHYLKLDKIEKELNFYKISVTSGSEHVAHFLPLALTNVTANFYTEIKSDIARRNLQMLEHEADSLKYELDKSLQSSLVQREQVFNLNPAFQSAEAPAKKSEVQTRVLQETYQTVVQNLEIARATLQKVTPVYQVIDEPGLALPVSKPGLVSSFLIAALLATFFCVFFLLIKKTLEES